MVKQSERQYLGGCQGHIRMIFWCQGHIRMIILDVTLASEDDK